jgi:cyclase
MQSCARTSEIAAGVAMVRVKIAVAATLMALSGSAIAQAPPAASPPPDFSTVEIKTTDLGNDVYMLEGQGGNITVAVAKDGIIMVDGQFAPLHDKIKAAIEAISKQPIKYLVNTHYHGDHTGGNELFAKDGVTIVSQINVRNRLAAGTTNGLTGAKTPPAPQDALPSDTYTNFSKIRLAGRVADLKHIANAHTDGDTYVWFKTANVLATGDTFANGRYPNIDFANGGNIKGMIAAADAYLKLTNARSKIVPGHGPLGDRAALIEYRTMLVTARDRMEKLVKDGKSEDDAVAAKPFADLDAKWAPTELASKNFIRVVYHSIADKPDTRQPLFKRIFHRS